MCVYSFSVALILVQGASAAPWIWDAVSDKPRGLRGQVSIYKMEDNASGAHPAGLVQEMARASRPGGYFIDHMCSELVNPMIGLNNVPGKSKGRTGHWEMKWVPDFMQLKKASKVLHMEMSAAIAQDPPTVATYTPEYQRGISNRARREFSDGHGFTKYEGPAVTYRRDKPMTVDMCYYFCIPHETIYFAIGKGEVCTCFDHAEFKEVHGRHCNIPCPGDKGLMCGGDKAWNVSAMYAWIPKRTQLSCGKPPAVANAQTTCSEGGKNSTSCPVTCKPGYQMRGNSLMCDTARGEWVGVAQCVEVKCFPPFWIPNVLRTCDSASVQGNGSCDVECIPGFTLRKNTLNCTMMVTKTSTLGIFQGEAICLGKPCGAPPNIPNTHYNPAEVWHPQKVQYACLPGYTVTGRPGDATFFQMRCGEGGTLTSPSVTECHPTNCGALPEIWHAQPVGSPPAFLVYPDAANFRCDHGYSLGGLAKSGVEFVVQCTAYGFSNIAGFDRKGPCSEIVCGIPPNIAFATLLDQDGAVVAPPATTLGALVPDSYFTTEVVFNEERKYRCLDGYSMDPENLQAKDITIQCTAQGSFISLLTGGSFIGIATCQPITCQPHPKVPNTISGGGTAFVFPMQHDYTCEAGHTVDGVATSPNSFRASCMADGKWGALGASSSGSVGACVPVVCPSPARYPNAKPKIEYASKVVYPTVLTFICEEGFSTDSTKGPGSDLFYTQCLETGVYGQVPTCVDIDDCAGHTCGPFGECKDQHMDYTCDCESGYEMHLIGGEKMCGNIDDCGVKACGVHGHCKDLINDYTCECSVGYELIVSPEGCEGKDCEKVCEAKECGELPEVNNCTTPGVKLAYPGTAVYVCHAGFQVTGTEETEFTVKCTSEGTVSPAKTCSPISCGIPPKADNADSPGGALVYPDVAAYTCKEGHTTSGEAGGSTTFTRACGSNGKYSQAQACTKISCGVPDTVSESTVPLAVLTYTEQATYTCMEGYSIDKSNYLLQQFVVKCEVDGTISGKKTCKAVDCGEPQEVKHGTCHIAGVPKGTTAMKYKDQVTCKCKPGYTVDGKITGESIFHGVCQKDQKITGMKACKSVECGDLPQQVNVVSSAAPQSVLVFGDRLSYECKPGYAPVADSSGEPVTPSTDARSYEVECTATGAYVSHATCKNIDDCAKHTCGPNGKCVDGIEDYKCECAPGYQESMQGGEKWCGDIVDCDATAQANCGQSKGRGTCLELVQGYSCKCLTGYELLSGPTRCSPKVCPAIEVQGGTSMTQPVKLKFPESVSLVCKDGYSVDGSVLGTKKQADVSCQADGTLKGVAPCQKVTCDDPPSVDFSKGPGTSGHVFGDKVSYTCTKGHTLNGTATGTKTFSATCSSAGEWKGLQECDAVSCGSPPSVKNGNEDAEGNVSYLGVVNYKCDDGNKFITTKDGGSPPSSFQVKCQADGRFSNPPAGLQMTPSGGFSCDKMSCGAPAAVNHATAAPSTAVSAYGTVKYTCAQGYTANGRANGLTSWSVSCLTNGQFRPGPDQVPATACSVISYKIEGTIIDSTNKKGIPRATVTLLNSETRKPIANTPVVTADNNGVYTLFRPAGTVMISVSKGGYVPKVKSFPVSGEIKGGITKPNVITNVALTPTLPEGGWQMVLEWKQTPLDLDSHTEFGPAKACELYYNTPGRTLNCQANKWKATLDVDDRDGVGPETTTFGGKNPHTGEYEGLVDKNTCGDNCKFYFKVKNYSGEKDIKTSAAVVTLTKGTKGANQVKVFKISAANGSATGDGYVGGGCTSTRRRPCQSQNWYVFSVDVKKDEIKGCKNAKCD